MKMENYKSVFLPSVELTAGFRFLNTEWFQPFVYSGLQFYGAVTKSVDPIGDVLKQHDYYGSLLAGLGIEFQVKPDANLVYLSWDYRNALLSSVNPSPEYWVMKAGITFQFGKRESYRRDISFPYEEDLFSSLGTVEQSDIGSQLSFVEMESVSARIEAMEKEILETKETVRNIENKFSDVENKMVDSQIKTHVKPVTYVEASKILLGLSTEEAYKKGLEEFMKNNYLTALSIFRALLEVYPDFSLASNCHYWVGECYYAIGQYQDAIQAFSHVFKYQKSFKYDDALIMLGQSYLNLEQNELAFSSFRELMDRYPDSEYIGRAKQYINNL
jgi:tol-pal system protein YbgF